MAAKDTQAGTIRQEQHTGNHGRPEQERAGNEKLGGTRAGKENVEREKKGTVSG